MSSGAFLPCSARRLLLAAGALALALTQAAPGLAQPADLAAPHTVARQGYALSKASADELETLLEAKPDDLAARTKLLGFYFRGGKLPRDAAIEARRRHILWIVVNRPESAVAGLSEMTLDARGHALADPAGFEQIAARWIAQTESREKDVRVLGHAARFFLLPDKERAAGYLKRAAAAEPANPEWRARLGHAYALAILGVGMMNQNGLPMAHHAADARGPFALRTIDELKNGADAIVIGTAGSIIGQHGMILSAIHRGPEPFAVDHVALSDALLARAHELDPQNPAWPSALEQVRALRAMAPK